MFHDILIYHSRRNANHYTTKLLTSFLSNIHFFFLFHSNYTRDSSLFLSASLFLVTCTRMDSDSVAQLNCLRLVEPYNRAGITHTFNHYTTTITTTTATATTATTTFFSSSSSTTAFTSYLVDRVQQHTRIAAYTPLNRSNQPRQRARTHWQPLLHSHPERATLRTLTALLTHYRVFCIKRSLTDACQLVRVKPLTRSTHLRTLVSTIPPTDCSLRTVVTLPADPWIHVPTAFLVSRNSSIHLFLDLLL